MSTPRALAPLVACRDVPAVTANAYECYADLNATLKAAREAIEVAGRALDEAVEVNKFLRALLHPADQRWMTVLRRDGDQIQAQRKAHERAHLALMALPDVGEPADESTRSSRATDAA